MNLDSTAQYSIILEEDTNFEESNFKILFLKVLFMFLNKIISNKINLCIYKNLRMNLSSITQYSVNRNSEYKNFESSNFKMISLNIKLDESLNVIGKYNLCLFDKMIPKKINLFFLVSLK